MKKILNFISVLCLLATVSCSDGETYAEQKEKEGKAIKSFLNRDVSIYGTDGDMICHVGKINVISEKQFLAQDSMTNLENNEYVLFKNSGLYMQIIRKGPGEKLAKGETRRVICRFIEYNILGDSLQLRDDVLYWATNPEILDVENNSGTITASFNTTINGGGAMYQTYNSTSVPTGWITPMSYINIGRQTSPDEGIAKVRIIVPHTLGHQEASASVYPCFYEITYQEMRD